MYLEGEIWGHERKEEEKQRKDNDNGHQKLEARFLRQVLGRIVGG